MVLFPARPCSLGPEQSGPQFVAQHEDLVPYRARVLDQASVGEVGRHEAPSSRNLTYFAVHEGHGVVDTSVDRTVEVGE